MFTVIARHSDAKTEAQPVAERTAAMTIAWNWSRTSGCDVQVYRRGGADPLCVYRNGVRVFCGCPDAATVNAP